MEKLKLAIFQMAVCPEKEDNFQKFEDWVAIASASKTDLVVLPEFFATPFDPELLVNESESFDSSEVVHTVIDAALRHNVTIIGGSFPERDSEDRVWNTSFAVNPFGEVVAKYRKIHLFDPGYPGVEVRESEFISPGDQLALFECCGWPTALAICYDLRFPLMFDRLRREGASLIIVPAAFNHISGPDHWELLARARALDSQTYLVGASPAPNLELKYSPWGHSLVVDPWGSVLVDAGNGEGISYCVLDPNRINEVREHLPLFEQARPDLY